MSGKPWNGRTDLIAGLGAGALAAGLAATAQYVEHAETSMSLLSFAGMLVVFATAALRRYQVTRSASTAERPAPAGPDGPRPGTSTDDPPTP